MRTLALVLLSVAIAGVPATQDLSAQDIPPRHLTASLGVVSYELVQSGVAPMLAVRGTTPISTVIILEAGLVASRPEYQIGRNSTFLAPEAQLQLALPFNSVVPYMGLGAGAVFDLGSGADGGSDFDMTISGSLGLRAWLTNRMGIQAEFRGRGIGFDFAGSSAEYSVGLAWQI